MPGLPDIGRINIPSRQAALAAAKIVIGGASVSAGRYCALRAATLGARDRKEGGETPRDNPASRDRPRGIPTDLSERLVIPEMDRGLFGPNRRELLARAE